MEPYYQKASVETPEINFNKDQATFILKGKSFPEESRSFYQPAIDWMMQYADEPNPKTDFIMQMHYYNSSSSAILLEIFKILERIHLKGNEVTIHWHYDLMDDDMLEAGEEYEELLKVPFVFQGMEEEEE